MVSGQGGLYARGLCLVNFVAFDDLACPAAEPLLQNYKQPNRVDSENTPQADGTPCILNLF